MHLKHRLAAAFVLLAAASLPAHAARFTGIVTHVIDGDTVWVRPDSGRAPQPIRLEGIDAPEICQAHGMKSRTELTKLVLHKRVTVDGEKMDDHQRLLARLRLGEQDVGEWLVAHGHAWSYRFKRDGGPYLKPEETARRARLGLWHRGHPITPREFRIQHGPCRR